MESQTTGERQNGPPTLQPVKGPEGHHRPIEEHEVRAPTRGFAFSLAPADVRLELRFERRAAHRLLVEFLAERFDLPPEFRDVRSRVGRRLPRLLAGGLVTVFGGASDHHCVHYGAHHDNNPSEIASPDQYSSVEIDRRFDPSPGRVRLERGPAVMGSGGLVAGRPELVEKRVHANRRLAPLPIEHVLVEVSRDVEFRFQPVKEPFSPGGSPHRVIEGPTGGSHEVRLGGSGPARAGRPSPSRRCHSVDRLLVGWG